MYFKQMGKRGQSTLRRVGSSIIFPVSSKRMRDKGMTSVSIKARSVAHDKSWIKARYIHHQWNSGSMQARYTFIGFFCLIILQERCTTNLDLFCYGYDHQHRALSLNWVEVWRPRWHTGVLPGVAQSTLFVSSRTLVFVHQTKPKQTWNCSD